MHNSSCSAPVFCIVDPSLRDFVGHHFAYDAAVARGAMAAGYQAVTLGHRLVTDAIAGSMQVVRCFRRDMWGGSPLARHLPSPLRAAGDMMLANRDFRRDLEAGLRDIPLPAGSVLFAHMIFRNQLLALAQYVRDQPAAGPVSVILLLRYQASFYDNPLCAHAFRMLERAAAEGRRVRLASDSARLSLDIGRLTTLPVEVMPIPHTAEAHAGSARQPGAPLRFVSLGNARDEKGYLEILDAIRLLRDSGELGGTEFVLQSNDAAPDVQAAIDAFSAECPPNVTLLRQALSPDEYEAQLLAADVMLVPYWRGIYHARTSGVFLEGVAAGKVVIATRDTWMSDELEKYGAGVMVDDRSPASIAEAIRTAVRERARLLPLAARGKVECLARHSPAALVQQAIHGPQPEDVPQRKIRRLAIFYPWGDFAEGRSGAALRANLLVDKLAPLMDEIRVVQDGPWGLRWPSVTGLLRWGLGLPIRLARRGVVSMARALRLIDRQLMANRQAGPAMPALPQPLARHPNVSVEMVSPRFRQHVLRRLFRLPFRLLLGRAHFGQELMLWFMTERAVDPRFAARVAELVAWSDAVLLEYPIWANVVAPACRAKGRPLILSNYDVLHQQVTHSATLHRLTRYAELRGMAAADVAICVSEEDRACFAAAGIAARVIPNPVDLERLATVPAKDPREMLRVLYGIELPPGPFGFFIGSRFPPNVDAAQSLRLLARLMSQGPLASLVVAGACAPAGRDGRFIALGRVEDGALPLLYQAAAVIVIPLRLGTGSSLKTVEAMAAGRPILGAPTAFRGLAVRPGVDCLEEEDLTLWPDRLRTLLEQPEAGAAMGAAARRTAERYDYRLVFEDYLPLLGLASSQNPVPSRVPPLPPDLLERCFNLGRFDLALPLLDDPARLQDAATPGLLRNMALAGFMQDQPVAVDQALALLERNGAPFSPPADGKPYGMKERVLALLGEHREARRQLAEMRQGALAPASAGQDG